MTSDGQIRWRAVLEWLWSSEVLAMDLDISKMPISKEALDRLRPALDQAFVEMDALEGGAISNPDENRMVGHYWLRAPELAPTAEIRRTIEATISHVCGFVEKVHLGSVAPAAGGRFEHLLVVGIGGSALGPQLVSSALCTPEDKMSLHFLDNTDPDGFDRVLAELTGRLPRTLTLVISKSGGTAETRNGMLEAQAAYTRLGIPFARHAVAITGVGSGLDQVAQSEGWLERFPMWDWVGGRTSETSAVGLLPAALQGIHIRELLRGAREMDQQTRSREIRDNPAALLAFAWYVAGDGQGKRAMVVLPYKDRLELFSRYLQQLVMESLGKELDRAGKTVHQGLTVYGNKGSTDQHAYVQQLRDGRSDFFVTFLEVLEDRKGPPVTVEPGLTAGDYLSGFLQGTRMALMEKSRPSLTLTIEKLDAAAMGRLIALFERAVGFYASLIGVNAYHQPGVEAGKRAASLVLKTQGAILENLRGGGKAKTAEEVASEIGSDDVEMVFCILRRLAANPRTGVSRSRGATVAASRFSVSR